MNSNDSQYPALRILGASGLSFAWAEYQPSTQGTSSASLGPDGVGAGMVMIIYFDDLRTAIQELLGYSYIKNDSQLGRKLPWQHPYYSQLWLKSISNVQGLQMKGSELLPTPEAGAGIGYNPNYGPFTKFKYVLLTLQFWRPPYYVRSDKDITNGDGTQQEWLRYFDRHWAAETQMLSREGTTFAFVSGQGTPSGKQFVGSVGQQVVRQRLKRTWYQVPEQFIYQQLDDDTLNGMPHNQLYTFTETTNPVTGFVYRSGMPIIGCVNISNGGSVPTVVGDTVDGSDEITNIVPGTSGISVGDELLCSDLVANTVVTDIIDPTSIAISTLAFQTATATAIQIDARSTRFLGCYIGTLLLVGVEFNPRPLQLPADLMLIPSFGSWLEPIAQQQVDVTFHFELFDPPRSETGYYRGHNNMPWSGDGMWYTVESKSNVDGTGTLTTPFQYADFTDLFVRVIN